MATFSFTVHRKQRNQSLRDGVIPMGATTPSNRYSLFNGVDHNYMNVQPSSAHPVAAGAFGDVGDRDINYEDPSDYERITNDQANRSRAMMRRNSPHPSIVSRARNSLIPT